MNKFYLLIAILLSQKIISEGTITINNPNGLAITVVWGDEQSGRTNQFEDGQTSRTLEIPDGFSQFMVTCNNIDGCYSKLPDTGKTTKLVPAIAGRIYYVTCDNNNCTNQLLLTLDAPSSGSNVNQQLQDFFLKGVHSTMSLPGSEFSANEFASF